MFNVQSKGSSDNLERFLKRMQKNGLAAQLEGYGRQGTDALARATPVHTGLSAASWKFVLDYKDGFYVLSWHNTNVVTGVPVVILIQYGHGTKNGGWVEGNDFINPVIRPLFDNIADEVWKEVTNG